MGNITFVKYILRAKAIEKMQRKYCYPYQNIIGTYRFHYCHCNREKNNVVLKRKAA